MDYWINFLNAIHDDIEFQELAMKFIVASSGNGDRNYVMRPDGAGAVNDTRNLRSSSIVQS
jgi:hypothetical protein